MNPEDNKEEPLQNPNPNDIITPSSDDAGDDVSASRDESIESTSTESTGSSRGGLETPTQKPTAGQPNSKGKRFLMILLIVLLLVAAAVGAFWYLNKEDSSTTSQSTNTETPKNDIALIRYGTGEGTLNGFAPTGNDFNSVTAFVNRQIFEGLVRFEDKSKITPALAESWTNPDDTTWIFTLKKDVKFHSGNTLKASDVVYSYNQVKNNDDFAGTVTPTIKNVEAVGEDKVKITTEKVDPILLNRLTYMFIIDAAAEGENDPKFGTGPYEVKEATKPTETSIKLAAFDGYHGGHVYTREVEITRYDDEEGKEGSAEQAMLTDLKAGKLDIAGHLSGKRLADAKAANLNTFSEEDTAVYYLNLATNLDGSPITKPKVRQAMYEAIDVPALLSAIGREETATSANQILPKLIPGYNPDIVRPNKDIEHAKQLLIEAGYPNGAPITLTVYVAAQDAGQELARQLRLANFKVNLVLESDVDKFFSDYDAGIQEVGYGSYASDFGDASDVFAIGVPPVNYTNEELAAILEEADSTLDQSKRLELYQQASKIVMDNTAIVPLYINQPSWATAKDYKMVQDMFANDLNIYFYKVYL